MKHTLLFKHNLSSLFPSRVCFEERVLGRANRCREEEDSSNNYSRFRRRRRRRRFRKRTTPDRFCTSVGILLRRQRRDVTTDM